MNKIRRNVGHSTQTYRFLEALQHGCVLVVLSDQLRPPLHRALDWARAPVLFWPTSRIPTLDTHLASVPAREWRRMQQNTQAFALMLDFRYPVFWELLLLEVRIARERRAALPAAATPAPPACPRRAAAPAAASIRRPRAAAGSAAGLS